MNGYTFFAEVKTLLLLPEQLSLTHNCEQRVFALADEQVFIFIPVYLKQNSRKRRLASFKLYLRRELGTY